MSTKSASFASKAPRSVGFNAFHEECLNAARAAETAVSTSEAEAAWTEVIGVSSLHVVLVLYQRCILTLNEKAVGNN